MIQYSQLTIFGRIPYDGRPEPQAVKAYRVLRAILNTAVKEDEILKANPCRIKGFDSYHTPERPAATITQVEALAEAMPARFYALIVLAAYSGLRWGELVALRRCDIDLDVGTVRVVRKMIEVRGKLIYGPPKSEAGIRTVNIPKRPVGALRVHLDLNVGEGSEALIFTGEKGAPLRASNFRRAADWEEACQDAGLPKGFHFHDLRHLGNLMAAEAGASTRELMHRLGQSTMRAALIYQHATAKRDREIADEIDRRLAKATNHNDEATDDDDDEGLAGVAARVR